MDNPFDPDALLIVATVVLDELQNAAVVKFCVLLPQLDNVPVAVNCCVSPFGILTLAGVTAIDAT